MPKPTPAPQKKQVKIADVSVDDYLRFRRLAVTLRLKSHELLTRLLDAFEKPGAHHD